MQSIVLSVGDGTKFRYGSCVYVSNGTISTKVNSIDSIKGSIHVDIVDGLSLVVTSHVSWGYCFVYVIPYHSIGHLTLNLTQLTHSQSSLKIHCLRYLIGTHISIKSQYLVIFPRLPQCVKRNFNFLVREELGNEPNSS